MKIALDATYSVGENRTGVGVYSREILDALAALRPETAFLWCYRPRRWFGSLGSPHPPNCYRRLLWETRAVGADLFHGLNQRAPAARCRRSVTTFHDLFVLTGDYSTPEFRARFAARARDAAARSDLIIAVSQFTGGEVERLLGVERGRLRVIPHGVRLPSLTGELPRRKIILTVGAVQRRKNTVRVVEAFERLPEDWRLVIAGSFGYGGEAIRTRIDSSPRRDAIETRGYVSAAELERLYRTASVFAFPSLDEGFGMPVLEAMAHGLPVVTSNRSALPEVAGDAALGVDPENVDEIAAALRRLIEEPPLAAELIRRGRERAGRFQWQDAAAKTWAVYRELLDAC